jgi:hypothetical protein
MAAIGSLTAQTICRYAKRSKQSSPTIRQQKANRLHATPWALLSAMGGAEAVEEALGEFGVGFLVEGRPYQRKYSSAAIAKFRPWEFFSKKLVIPTKLPASSNKPPPEEPGEI